MPLVAASQHSQSGRVRRSNRDHRIDWLRGVALVSIFINHMPGNRLAHWTTRNFGFSDAAEVFVLLAGVAAAFAFFPRFASGEHVAMTLKALHRAAVLYGAHIASTLAAIAIFGGAAWLFSDRDIFELIGIAPVLADPLLGALGVMVGGHQLGYFNILPLYVFLIVLTPVLLWLAQRDVWAMIAASGALYLLAHLLPIEMPNFPTDAGWFFNPFAWQLLFAIGLGLGILKLRGGVVPWHPVVGLLAAAYCTFAGVWMLSRMGGRISFGLLPSWMDSLHKSALPLARLAHVLALAYLLVHSPLWAWLARLCVQNPLTLLGRNSLPVFVLGSLLSMVGYITLVETGSSLWLDLVLAAGGVGLMLALATAIEARVLHDVRVSLLAHVRTWLDRHAAIK